MVRVSVLTPASWAVGRALSCLLGCLLGVVWMAGCAGGADGDGGWVATVDTLSTGAVHLGYQPALDRGPESSLVEELRIGTPDGSGPAAFGQIKGVQVLANGNVAVLDAMAREIRVFDPQGAHVASFGGQGDGPGEFQEPFGLMLDVAGRLWVPDFRTARMSVVDPEAGFQASYPLMLTRYGWIWDGAITRDGRILEVAITIPERKNIVRVHDQAMEVVDSLPLPDDPPVDRENPPGAFYWEAPGGRAMGYMGIPGYPGGTRTFDDDGRIWSTDHGDFAYRIKHWQPGGDTILRLEVHRPPVSVPAAERDSIIGTLRDALAERGAADQDWSKVPEQRPLVRSLLLTAEGDLWVETPAGDGAALFDRFGPDGSYLSSVASPVKFSTDLRPTVRGDQVWGVVTDDFDVQYVVRMRVVEAGEG